MADDGANRIDKQLADIIQQENALHEDMFGRGDPDPIGIPLMKPIEAAPTDGRQVILYCPDETPAHVAAKYVKVYDKDGGGWEGWIYVDPLLADIAPEGPVGPTHFYEPPTPDTKLALHAGGVLRQSAFNALRTNDFWCECPAEFSVPSERYEDDRFTLEQLAELKYLGGDPKTVPTTIRTVHSVKTLPVTRAMDPHQSVQKIDTAHDFLCPVIQIDRQRNKASIIMPNGQVQRVTPIPTLS